MDIQLHYTRVGSGPALLLLHGNGEDSGYFEHQIAEFSRDFCVYAVDTRGHGLSPRGTAPFTLSQFADDLLAFMDQNGLEKADILGFSDGGNIALLFTLRYPERVRRLILNSANLYPEGIEPWLLQSMVRDYESACVEQSTEAEAAADLLALMLYEPHIDPEELAALTMPTLVIAGDRDVILGEHTLLIAETIPNARLAILPGGHDVANRHPAAFNAAVRAFFEETPVSEEEFE